MHPSHVLITRPEPEAAELAGLLAETGVQVIALPVFTFNPAHPGLDFHDAWPDASRRLAVFCSTRAVEFGLRQLPAGFLEGVEIAAIGPATARQLEAAGHPPSIVPEQAFDSEALLSHPGLAGRPGSALLFAARGGRQKLFVALAERGWQVRFAHVYRPEPLKPAASAIEAIMASRGLVSVWTSGNALQYLAQHMPEAAWARVCAGGFVVISERIAGLAAAYAQGTVVLTRGPGNPEIAAAVKTLLTA
jgi:uroporphyrinogen-III synthase